jgi:hypothetical protein
MVNCNISNIMFNPLTSEDCDDSNHLNWWRKLFGTFTYRIDLSIYRYRYYYFYYEDYYGVN